jgi:WD40 repeat protein
VETHLTEAEVDRGRRALLEGKYTEALAYLAEAARRGDRSPSVAFMLARAAQPLQSEVMRLNSPVGRMWSARFSPDGQSIITTDNQAARLWDAQTGRMLFTLPHTDVVYDAAFMPGGARLVTAGDDGFVKIWDLSTGTLMMSLTHNRPDDLRMRYWSVEVSPDGQLIAAIASSGSRVDVWDAATGAAMAELSSGCAKYGTSLAFSSDGQWLATSCGDDAQVFDTRAWQRVLTLPVPELSSLSFDPTGPRIATASLQGDAAIWQIPTGKRLQSLPEAGERIYHIAFSPDGALVVTAAQDGAERVWDAKTGGLQVKLKNHRGNVLWAEFDPSSRRVVSSGGDGVVAVSDLATGLPVTVLEGSQGRVAVAHFDPSSRRVMGISMDGVAVWDVTSPYRRWSSSPITADCSFHEFEEDRRAFPVSCKDHGTHVWDTATDQIFNELPSVTPPGGDFELAEPAISAAGDLVAIAEGHTVEIYSLPGVRRVRSVAHPANVSAVSFASTGHDLVSASVDGSLLITRDDREPVPLPSFPGGIDVVRFAHDGRVIAAGARRQLRVYDPERGQILAGCHSEPSMFGCPRVGVGSSSSRRAWCRLVPLCGISRTCASSPGSTVPRIRCSRRASCAVIARS